MAWKAIEGRAQLRLGVAGAAALDAVFQVSRQLGAHLRREAPRHECHQGFTHLPTVHHPSPRPVSPTGAAGGA